MDKDFFLIRRMKKGDEDAVEAFIMLYYRDIYSFCYHKLSDKWLAEDLTQDTFANFFRHFNTYVHKGKAKNYLYVIAGNLCKNEYKKKKSILLEDTSFSKEGKQNQQNDLLEKIVFEETLKKLPKDYKEVIQLYYYHNLKIREISDMLGITVSLVKYRLSESKKLLQKYIKKEDFYE